MTSEPEAPGAPAIILFRQVDRDDNLWSKPQAGAALRAERPHEDDYYRIKILTEEGRKYATVEIPFVKADGEVVGIHARTIRPDGSIAQFDGKVYDSVIEKTRGYKYLAKTFTLPDVQVGGIIEYFYSYVFNDNFLYGSYWLLSQDLFTKNARFILKPYMAPNDYYTQYFMRWSWHDLPPGSSPKQDAEGVVRMDASNIPAFEMEDFMPPANDLKARVDFIYSEDPEKDADTYWKKFGRKKNAQLDAFVGGKQKAMEAAVTQIIAPGDAPEMKLRKIYDRVQQLRNTSYEPQKTRQETKREKDKAQPNAEDIWKHGAGSDIDLTWLFLGLVRAAGFEASGVWVSERRNHLFTPAIMQGWRLDSNVVLMTLNGKETYFDPGTAFNPFGMLPWSETGVQGLRLDGNGGTWIKTPLPASSESRIERKANLKLSDKGDLEGKLTVTYTGLEAVDHRIGNMHSDDVARKKTLEDAVKSQIPVAAEVELTNHPDWSSSETPLVAEFNLKVTGWASNAGKRVLIPAAVFTAWEKHIFESANRTHAIYLDYPYEKADDVKIELPAGWQIGSLPAGKDKDVEVASYTLAVEGGKDTLHLTRKLRADYMQLKASSYSSLRNFYESVRTGDEEQIVLQPATSGASGY
jgi:hypothetical protein